MNQVSIIEYQRLNQNFGLIIGNFDGVHLGHLALIKKFVANAKKKNLIPVALTFRPHPCLQIHEGKTDFLITSYQRKYALLESSGIEVIVEVNFSDNIQKMSATEFLSEVILKNSNLKYVHLGHDFKLGKGKEDSYKILEELASGADVQIEKEDSFSLSNKVVSSSTIRKFLKSDIEEANRMLGRNYILDGQIVSGKGVGKKKLFPTANLSFESKSIVPNLGVYLTKFHFDGKVYESVTNIGVNPTVADNNLVTVETFLLFHSSDLYTKNASVEFIKKIREEKKFNSFEELKDQISRDIEFAKNYFRSFSHVKLALIGKDISHSKSRQMYEELLERSVDYTLIDCANSGDIPKAKDLLKKFNGVSITAPYKKHFLTETIPVPSDLNSVNTLYCEQENILSTNTDILAIEDILDQYIKERDIKNVFVLGDGAMSNITITLLKKRRLNHKVLSRKNDRLNQLDDYINSVVTNLLVINTCARTYTFNGNKEFNYAFWDMNYGVESHHEYFKNSKVDYIDGLYQLKLQAKYALKYWNLNS